MPLTHSVSLTFILMLIRRFASALLLILVGTVQLEAQQPDSGTVNVTIREAMGMVEGFLIRSETRSAMTDASGQARLVLPVGQRSLALTRIGLVMRVLISPSRPRERSVPPT